MNYYYPQSIDTKSPGAYPGLHVAGPGPGVPNGAGIPGGAAGLARAPPGPAGLPTQPGLSTRPGVPAGPGVPIPGLPGSAGGMPGMAGSSAGAGSGMGSSEQLAMSAYHQSQQAGGTTSPSSHLGPQAQAQAAQAQAAQAQAAQAQAAQVQAAHAQAAQAQYASMAAQGYVPASSYSLYQPPTLSYTQAQMMSSSPYGPGARATMAGHPLASTTYTPGYYSPAAMSHATQAQTIYGYSGLCHPSLYGPPMAYPGAPHPSQVAQSPGLAQVQLGSSLGYPSGSIYTRPLP